MKKTIQPKPEFLERIKKLLPDPKDFDGYKKSIQEPLLNSIRCNTLKISSEQLKKRLEEKNWKIFQPWKEHPEVMIIEGKFVDENINNEKNLESNNKEEVNKKNINNKTGSNVNNKLNKSERRMSEQISAMGWASDSARLNLENKFEKSERGQEKGGETTISKKILIDLEPGELGRSIEHLLGYYYVQELASMLSIIALKPKPNELILDLCASPGSKTSQMASEMKNTGTIIANDINIGRIKILASNLERCGVMNTILTREDGIRLCEKLKNQGLKFNKILLDAPCSGEGTIKSSPKSAIMWNLQTIKSLSKLQKKLFGGAFEILKSDGEIVYSTCTHAPEENEAIVDFALKEFGNKIEIEKIILPVKCREGILKWNDELYNEKIKLSCRIYPQDNNTEGFFIAKFKKLK